MHCRTPCTNQRGSTQGQRGRNIAAKTRQRPQHMRCHNSQCYCICFDSLSSKLHMRAPQREAYSLKDLNHRPHCAAQVRCAAYCLLPGLHASSVCLQQGRHSKLPCRRQQSQQCSQQPEMHSLYINTLTPRTVQMCALCSAAQTPTTQPQQIQRVVCVIGVPDQKHQSSAHRSCTHCVSSAGPQSRAARKCCCCCSSCCRLTKQHVASDERLPK